MEEKERIIVTGYSSPDLDATACAIAYTEFLQKKGTNAVVALFGIPHREAQFVFKTFHINPPVNAERILTKEDKIILVDSSDLRGISNKINPRQVIELIDHRKINEADRFPHAKAHIEFVGSCATLIAEKFFNENREISNTSAALLYSAIISNTVNFQANVTTDRDRKMCDWLKQYFVLPKNYIYDMFAAKSSFNKPLNDVFTDDFATYTFNGKHIGIAQLEIIESDNFVKKNKKEIEEILMQVKKEKQLNLIFLTLIDVEKVTNTFIIVDPTSQELLEKALQVTFHEDIALKKGIMMRKTIVPLIKEVLENKLSEGQIKTLLFDFSRVLIFPKDETYSGLLNDLYKKAINGGNFNFYDSFTFNTELLTFLKTIKSHFSLDIYTTDILQSDPAAKAILEPIFDHIFSANELGLSKKDPQGFIAIAEKLGVKPNEILFIDDSLANIETAKKAGLQTIQFKSNTEFFRDIESRIHVIK